MATSLFSSSSFATLNLLDWDIIISKIQSYRYFHHTMDILAQAPTKLSKNEIEIKLDQLEYFINDRDNLLPELNQRISILSQDYDFNALIIRLKKGYTLELKEIHNVAQCFEVGLELSKVFEKLPLISSTTLPLEVTKELSQKFVKPLRRFISPNGDINFKGHPILGPLIEKVSQLEYFERSLLLDLQNRPEYRDCIQFDGVDQLNDRYVLAIKTDSYQHTHGNIIGRSATGNTLYVEPSQLRDRSNQRIQLKAQIEEIIQKIALEFCQISRPYSDIFLHYIDFIYSLDVLKSKALYSIDTELFRPEVSHKFEIHLNSFFHPLIDRPIKNNFFLYENKNGLIISGPNTGGKTVALKSICLCHLFMHMGLFVPATKAILFADCDIFYFSHDHQNLLQGLSSFGSEVKNYLELLNNLSDNNLVFIDEIFNTTSSEEASALAISLLDKIGLYSHSKVLLSTHHQYLKTYMHSQSNYISAHVSHDEKTNVPTYKILYGDPGSSMAFDIFSRMAKMLGMDTDIPNMAKTILGSKQLSYEQLLTQLSNKKAYLDKLINENKNLNSELKNKNKSMEGVLYLEKEKAIEKFNKELDNKIKEADKMLADIRENKIDTKKQMERKLISIKQGLGKNNDVSLFHVADNEQITTASYVENETYHAINLNAPVKLLQKNEKKNTGFVLYKNNRIQMPLANLAPLNNKQKAEMIKRAQQFTFFVDKETSGKIDYDCRGMRLEEFESLIDSIIFEVIDGVIPFAKIIHGHGDGILKNYLRKHIKGYPEISFEIDEWNDGQTILKKIN